MKEEKYISILEYFLHFVPCGSLLFCLCSAYEYLALMAILMISFRVGNSDNPGLLGSTWEYSPPSELRTQKTVERHRLWAYKTNPPLLFPFVRAAFKPVVDIGSTDCDDSI